MSEILPATSVIAPDRLRSAYSYTAYRQLLDELLTENRTTGPNQSEQFTRHAHLNTKRMQRLDKTIQLLPELQEALAQLRQSYAWLVITEGWCGDAAQLLPVFEAIGQASHGRISTHYMLRDENPDLIDRYLTDGGRAIPKLIVLHADALTEAAHWGPRPVPAQELFTRLKQAGIPFEEFAAELHGWYAQDKTLSTQHELLALLRQL